MLRRYGLSVFAEPAMSLDMLRPTDRPVTLHLEAVNDAPASALTQLTIDSSRIDMITLAGWAIGGTIRRPADGVFVMVNGERRIPALYGLDQFSPNVAYGSLSHPQAGFFASFGTHVLPPGRHSLRLGVVSGGGADYSVAPQEVILDVF